MRLIFFNLQFILYILLRQINALDASEAKKIRYKIVLALNHVNTDLYNPRSFDNVPLEMMPYLLECLQQDIGYNGFGKDIAPKNMPNMDTAPYSAYGGWNPETRSWESGKTFYGRRNPLTGTYEMKGGITKDTKSLSRVFEVIMSSQSLPQLFSRGPGEFNFTNMGDSTTTSEKTEKKKKKSKSKKRRKFGDADDDDDDAYIPKGARKRGKWERNPESGKYEYVPPPVY
jgi:hypothetical protein